jgi:hypothetical protein
LIREPDAADDRVKEAYRDIKESMRVSFVDSMFQAYAADPKFLDYVWRRLRPSMLAPPFVTSAKKVGEIADRAVEAWKISDHAASLHARNYGESDLRKLREIIELFHDANPKLLIVAEAVKVALTGEPIGGGGVPHIQAHVDRDKVVRDYRGVRVPLADEREAPLRVRTTFEELQRATGLSFVTTFYRAMGAYPDWLDVFWTDYRPLLADRRRRDLCSALAAAAQDAAKQVPYPLHINADAFPAMVEINDAFCALLPTVIVDVAIVRRSLG